METTAWNQFIADKSGKNFFRWLWSGIKRALLILVLFILIQVPPVAMTIIKHHRHLDLTVIIALISFVLIFLFVIWWARSLYKKNDQLHRSQKFEWRDLRAVFLGYLAIFAGQLVLGNLNRLIFHQTQTANNTAVEKLLASNVIILIALSASSVLFTPFAEEYIFRGVVTNLFFNANQFWPKVILSGFVFSLGHSSSNVISFLIYFYMGGVLAFLYLKTGKIHNSIMLHGFNNLIAIGALVYTILS